MSNEKVKWTKIGGYEHNLPTGKHLIMGDVYIASELTEEQLKSLHNKGAKAVRKAAKPATDPKA